MEEPYEAQHYDMLRTAMEMAGGTVPTSPEALAARARAIKEGRLTIVDTGSPDATGAETCVGCASEPPQYRRGGLLFPIGKPPGWSSYSLRAGVLGTTGAEFTDGAGNSVQMVLNGLVIDDFSGNCKEDSGTPAFDCMEQMPCAYLVDIEFWLWMKSAPGGPRCQPPNIQVIDPFTGATTAGSAATKVKHTGDETTCRYNFFFHTDLPCNTPFAYFGLDVYADFAPTPMTGSWTFSHYTTGSSGSQIELRLACGACGASRVGIPGV